jgi:hypothetical protein
MNREQPAFRKRVYSEERLLLPYVPPKRFQLSTDANFSLWDISLVMLELVTLLQNIWKEIVKNTGRTVQN